MLPEPNKKEGGGESPSYLAHPLQIFYYGYQWYYKAPKPELKTTGDAYSVRLWFYVLLIPVLWWFGINFLPFLLFLPYLAMGMGVDNAVNFGSSLDFNCASYNFNAKGKFIFIEIESSNMTVSP